MSASTAPPPYEEKREEKRPETNPPEPSEHPISPNIGSAHQGPILSNTANAHQDPIPSNTANVVYQTLPTTPTVVICPVCKESVTTEVKYSSGTFTYVMSFLCGLCFLCCCIPLCCRGCKDVHHFCPKCKAFIGMNRRL